MMNLFKKFLPKSIKIKIRNIIWSIIEENVERMYCIEINELKVNTDASKSEQDTRIETLKREFDGLIDNKRKLNKLTIEVYHLLPPEISMTDKVKSAINDFIDFYKVSPKLNPVISKNDLMFQYDLLHINSLRGTYINYLSTGLNAMNLVRKLINKKFGDLSKIENILDFASGYGRLTRFLVLEIDPEKIWVSDIQSK